MEYMYVGACAPVRSIYPPKTDRECMYVGVCAPVYI